MSTLFTGHHTRHDMDRAARLGWTYVSNVSCPRRLIRKNCRNWYGENCWCRNPLNDHGATWRYRTEHEYAGEMFVLWQPYSAWGDHLPRMLASARQDGLSVSISTQATWGFPGEPFECIATRFTNLQARAEGGIA